jgi:hypothetical protein
MERFIIYNIQYSTKRKKTECNAPSLFEHERQPIDLLSIHRKVSELYRCIILSDETDLI